MAHREPDSSSYVITHSGVLGEGLFGGQSRMRAGQPRPTGQVLPAGTCMVASFPYWPSVLSSILPALSASLSSDSCSTWGSTLEVCCPSWKICGRWKDFVESRGHDFLPCQRLLIPCWGQVIPQGGSLTLPCPPHRDCQVR